MLLCHPIVVVLRHHTGLQSVTPMLRRLSLPGHDKLIRSSPHRYHQTIRLHLIYPTGALCMNLPV